MQVAPNQISPGEQFDVFYFLRNHTDATTYYVRAKLYDVRTGELLDTIALDQSATNTRLFIKTVQAPADPTGYGRNVVAIATVYTDSGYTTKSDAYEEQEQYYLIKAVSPLGGGGGNIDLGAFRTIVREVVSQEIAALPKPDPVETPDLPFDALFGAIGALTREINRIPKETFDPGALEAKFAGIRALIESRPQFKETNLAQLQKVLNGIIEAIDTTRTDNREAATSLRDAHAAAAKDLTDAVLQYLETGMTKLMSQHELTIPLSTLLREKPEPAADVSHLMA